MSEYARQAEAHIAELEARLADWHKVADDRSVEIIRLNAWLAEVESERNTWQRRYSTLLDEFKDLRDGGLPELRARLAEVERALRRCADYLDASATCNSDRAMASMARTALAPDSATHRENDAHG